MRKHVCGWRLEFARGQVPYYRGWIVAGGLGGAPWLITRVSTFWPGHCSYSSPYSVPTQLVHLSFKELQAGFRFLCSLVRRPGESFRGTWVPDLAEALTL